MELIGVWIGVVAGAFAIIGGGWKFCHFIYNRFFRPQTVDEPSPVECVATRFINLFQSHGVTASQIPKFFDHGLSIHQCSSIENLNSVLTNEMLDDAAALFAVNVDWLHGVTDQIYDGHDFYKYPTQYEHFLKKLLQTNHDFFAYAIKAQTHVSDHGYDALLLISETIGDINERRVYRYHICKNWDIRYWKSRAYFAACCAITLRSPRVPLIGRLAPQEWIQALSEGTELMEYDYEAFVGEPKLPGHSGWHIDEFVERPEVYLEGIGDEFGDNSANMAISMWLNLDKQGFMKVWDDGSHESVTANFKEYYNVNSS